MQCIMCDVSLYIDIYKKCINKQDSLLVIYLQAKLSFSGRYLFLGYLEI